MQREISLRVLSLPIMIVLGACDCGGPMDDQSPNEEDESVQTPNDVLSDICSLPCFNGGVCDYDEPDDYLRDLQYCMDQWSGEDEPARERPVPGGYYLMLDRYHCMCPDGEYDSGCPWNECTYGFCRDNDVIEEECNMLTGWFRSDPKLSELGEPQSDYCYQGFETVVCDDEHHVISIDVSSYGVAGEVPQELSRLTKLETLDLSNNELVGALPQELAELEKLRVLDVSGNNIEGTIPNEYESLLDTLIEVTLCPNEDIQFGPDASIPLVDGFTALGFNGTCE